MPKTHIRKIKMRPYTKCVRVGENTKTLHGKSFKHFRAGTMSLFKEHIVLQHSQIWILAMCESGYENVDFFRQLSELITQVGKSNSSEQSYSIGKDVEAKGVEPPHPQVQRWA